MENMNPNPRPLRLYGVAGMAALVGVVLGALIAGSAAVYAHGGMRAWSGMHHGGMNHAEHIKERAADKVQWVLGRVDATDEQEAAVIELVGKAIDDMAPLVEQHRQNRSSIVELLASDTIDTEALERLRKAELALLDTGSQVLSRTVADAADVLSAEQRKELYEAVKRFHR